MDYRKKTVQDIDIVGKRILLRCDFNVPLKNGEITDDNRIVESLPTIEYLIQNGARIILCSHLGRPQGKYDAAYSLKPVAARLSQMLGKPVAMSDDVLRDSTRTLAQSLEPGGVMLMENVRFIPEEEANDPGFAQDLASLADVFVSDAFGAAHRAHATTCGVAKYLPAVAGFLLAKELEHIGQALTNPKRPFVAVLGGSKVSDKIKVIENIVELADAVIIGGGMAFTFIKARGGIIGKSLCETDKLDFARSVIEQAKQCKTRLLLPTDVVIAPSIKSDTAETCPADAIPPDMMGLDIGEATVRAFTDELRNAGMVIWNGPMGVFENPLFENGTRSVAETLASCGAVTIVGGGESAAAVRKYGVADKMAHVSTGGGAALEFMEGRELPGVACLLPRGM